jgi:hypothetical protein
MADPKSVPPMEPLDELPPEPRSWPKVIGIISICYAGLMLTCSGCGVGMLALMPQFMKGQPGIDEGFPPSMQLYPLKAGLFAISILWLLVLLGAGIATTMRRPSGRSLHLLWAVGALVLLAISMFVVQLPDMRADQQWMQDHPASPFAKQAGGQGGPFRYLGMAVGVVLGVAWPAFTLIWFGLVKRDSSDLDSGGPEPAA